MHHSHMLYGILFGFSSLASLVGKRNSNECQASTEGGIDHLPDVLQPRGGEDCGSFVQIVFGSLPVKE